MKAASLSTSSSTAANPIEIARARLVAAEHSVDIAKHDRRSAKRRRKQAELVARRAKKDLRRAREELDNARSALISAKTDYAEQLKAAIRAKKRSQPNVVRPSATRKAKKEAVQKLKALGSAVLQPVVSDGAPAGDSESSASPMVTAASLDDTPPTSEKLRAES